MRTLAQSLQDHDRGHLKIIASLWGMDLPNETHSQVVEALSNAMLERAPEILDTLPGNARETLDHLLQSGGRAPMETLTREYGPLREMGPSRRDRIEPWKEPESPLEMLWYRGFLAKAFADSAGGPQEFGFVPDDLLKSLPETTQPEARPLGNSAPAPRQVLQSDNFAVDDACTVLAAYRRSEQVDRKWLRQFLGQPESLMLLEELLFDAEIMESPELIRKFLEMPRSQALELLQKTWRGSAAWNELSQTPGVHSPTGKWPNDPVAGRQAALELLESVPRETWWSISSFIEGVHESNPEFMRPPGGFDSWYLQSTENEGSLRGFEAWSLVEAKYLEYLITGPLLWLGMAEVGRGRSAFRLAASPGTSSEAGEAVAWPDGRIRIGRGADRSLRYQCARTCLWERFDRNAYTYRLSAGSLKSAEGLGLTASHVGDLLNEISAPDSLLAAVSRWKERGEEAKIERQTILQVSDPEMLKMLLEHPITRRYISERLGPKVLAIDERQKQKLEEAALRLGLLIRSV